MSLECRSKILLVDDRPENLQVLYYALKNEYDLFSANSGARALAIAEKRHPDLILLDIMMPEMDGYEVCRRLKESETLRDVPVMFLTALNEDADELAGLALGAVDYITKPCKPAIVRQRVATQLALKHKSDLLVRSNRALMESEAVLRTLLVAIEQSPVSVVITDLDTTIRYVNPEFTKITGYTAQEAIGRKVHFLKSGQTEKSVYEDLWKTLRQAQPWTGEFIDRRKNGQPFWVEAYIAPVCDGNNVPTQYVAVKVDISDRKKYERELRVAHDKIAEAYEVMREDLEAAARIQSELIPQKIVSYSDLTFDWLFTPSQFVSGDIFNILRVDDHHVAYYLLDVSGHGIPAALLSTTLSGVLKPSPDFSGPLRCPLPDPPYYRINPPCEVARQLNERFLNDGEQIQYFTMVYGILDIRTGEGSLTQAGHPSPIHQKGDGSVRRIGDGGFPIGMVPGVDYEEHPITLLPGERLFLYSDGITECANPEGRMFGAERLMAIIRRGHGESLRTVIRQIEAELSEFRGGGGYLDDVSLLALERTKGVEERV